MIKFCGCNPNTQASQYQDEKYGQGMRVFNPKKDKETWTCTCCGKTKQFL